MLLILIIASDVLHAQEFALLVLLKGKEKKLTRSILLFALNAVHVKRNVSLMQYLSDNQKKQWKQ